MSLTLSQKTSLYFNRPLNSGEPTIVEKVDYLIRTNSEDIAQGKANFIGITTERTKLWMANRIWQRDRLPVIAALDKVSSIENTPDQELTDAVFDVMKDMYLNYKYDSQLNSPMAM